MDVNYGRLIRLREDAKEKGEPILRDKSFELLISTVKARKPAKILEIGVNVGLSGIGMLLASDNSSLTGIEIDEEKIRAAKENYASFGVSDRVKIFCGDASEIIPLLGGKYDFIFLDGPKGHYGQYCADLLRVLSVGGILFADNVLYRGYVGKDKTAPHKHATIKHGMEKFLETVTGAENLKTVDYELEDGVSVTEKLYD